MRAFAIFCLIAILTSVALAQNAGYPAQPEAIRLQWASPAVKSGNMTYDGYRRMSVNGGAVQAVVENMAPRYGLAPLGSSKLSAQIQKECSGPGFDQSRVPAVGRMQGPQGFLQATVDFAGLWRSQDRSWKLGDCSSKSHQERYVFEVTLTITSAVTRLPLASAHGYAVANAEFTELRTPHITRRDGVAPDSNAAMMAAIGEALVDLTLQARASLRNEAAMAPTSVTISPTSAAKFCPECGKPVTMAGAKFSPCCGKPLQ